MRGPCRIAWPEWPIALRLRDLLERCRSDQRGIAMVEFAMILPLMLVLYVCTSAVTLAVSASRSTAVLARTLTDLTSQQKANTPLTDTTAKNIFNASTTVMAPFPTTTLKMTLSNVEFVVNPASTASNGLDAKTRWTVTFSGGTLRPCAGRPLLTPVANGSTPSPSTIPFGLYSEGFLIVADVTYVYTPTFGYFNYNFETGKAASSAISFTMSHTTYMRPRQTDNIRYTSGQTAVICPITSPQSS